MIVYNPKELHFLLRQWYAGTLDHYDYPGVPIPGMKGVVRFGRKIRSLSLVERFVSEEVDRALQSLFQKQPEAAAAVVMVHALDKPIEALAAGLGVDCSEAGYRLLLAEDAFVEELYALET